MMQYKIIILVVVFFLYTCSTDVLKTKEQEGRLDELWKVSTKAPTSLLPSVYNEGIIYYLVGDGLIEARNAQTGELIWDYGNTDDEMNNNRIYVDETQVYATFGSYLHAFDKKTGQLIYKIQDNTPRGGGMNCSNFVYVTQGNLSSYSLVAADKKTGTIAWKAIIQEELWDSPAVNEDFLFLSTMYSGYLIKINRFTGEIIYKIPVKPDPYGGATSQTPVFCDRLVIIASIDDIIRAYDKNTGEIVWTYDHLGESIAGAICHALKVNNEILYFATQDCYVVAVDAKTGSLSWITEVGGSCNYGPVQIYNDFLFMRSADSYMYCIDKNTGKILYKKDNYSSPYIYDNILFVGSYDKNGDDYFSAFKIKK